MAQEVVVIPPVILIQMLQPGPNVEPVKLVMEVVLVLPLQPMILPAGP